MGHLYIAGLSIYRNFAFLESLKPPLGLHSIRKISRNQRKSTWMKKEHAAYLLCCHADKICKVEFVKFMSSCSELHVETLTDCKIIFRFVGFGYIHI